MTEAEQFRYDASPAPLNDSQIQSDVKQNNMSISVPANVYGYQPKPIEPKEHMEI